LPRLIPPGVYRLDKLPHLVAYALLAVPPGLGLRRRAAALTTGLLLVLVGLGIELTQGFMAGRLGSAEDALVNVLGVALGLTAASAVRRAGRRWAEPTRADSGYRETAASPLPAPGR
jgi:VanZ family protein